uniref:DUF834 domain-containing protein n=1 Tax=Oryza barthii TaxID=65489 RepID=A0A0D3GWY9_9ORYZ
MAKSRDPRRRLAVVDGSRLEEDGGLSPLTLARQPPLSVDVLPSSEVDGRRGGGSPAAQLSVAREWQRVEGAGGGVKWKSCGGRTGSRSAVGRWTGAVKATSYRCLAGGNRVGGRRTIATGRRGSQAKA